MKQQAFTLAEILITLGIIGVVAAITIPTIISNHKKKVTVERLKTNYSILSQAVELSKRENGDISTWDSSLSEEEYAQIYIIPYLQSPKKIQYGKKGYYSVKSLADNWCIFWSGVPIYFMNNGSVIEIKHGWGSMNSQTYIIVDINGKNAPNILGKDTFIFLLNKTKNQLTAFCDGCKREYIMTGDPYSACTRETNAYYAGGMCAALIMYDGWKIADDYPW